MDHRDQTPQMLTIVDLATMAKVSTKTVRRWIKMGAVEAVKIGGTVRILPRDLIHTLERSLIFPRER